MSGAQIARSIYRCSFGPVQITRDNIDRDWQLDLANLTAKLRITHSYLKELDGTPSR